ncbi:root hair defective 3 gtp-binding protein (rhd3) protein [Babesia caballi]|uniref:Protein SEY1 homolog n=1 Tax=Babesia caballi TaxID=5871 RepID=A0AAV4M044_BABCB|nr:root hair defective 3 gtp-binding protein (rhd3) protein [Babesia caballi]
MPDKDTNDANSAVVTKPVEFVDYNCNIRAGFNEYLKHAQFDKLGFRYNVLSILGCQSSGKSSLLNTVFGLDFDVMNTKLGHSQTTKGLWGALVMPEGAEERNATLVIDVEGTDSRERGEGRLTFEHRSSLLCLAISDCVVVNLWYHSLGNLTGSNYGLLKTVVEANLELAEGAENAIGSEEYKTVLCFCIRDWFPELAPLETVREKVVNGYMLGIWNEIAKPERFKNMALEDLFRIELFGFNHALVQKAEFVTDARNFREAWETSIRPASYSRAVPSDGFFYYAQNILNTVKEQNHLDIPSQREMLANFRCQEIKGAVLEAASPKVAEMVSDAQAGSLDDFKARCAALCASVVEDYLESASRYDKETSVKIGCELVHALFQKLQAVFDVIVSQQCAELAVQAAVKMGERFAIDESGVSLMVGGRKALEVWPKFGAICEEIRTELWNALSATMAACAVRYEHDSGIRAESAFDGSAAADIFNVTFRNEVDVARARHVHALCGEIGAQVHKGFKVINELLLEQKLTSEKYWGAVNELIDRTYKASLESFRACYQGLVSSAIANEFEYLVFIVLLKSAKENLERIEDGIATVIVDRFEQFFQYQDFQGEVLPRSWESVSEEELKQTYAQCKKDALNIIAVLHDCKPPTLEVPKFDDAELKPNHVLHREFSSGVAGLTARGSSLTEELMIDTVKKCKKRFHEMYRTAQQLQSTSRNGVSWRNIPPAFWIFLIICGFNELCAMLRLVFKVQVLLPLLIIGFLALQYCSRAVFGSSADKVLEPVKAQARSFMFACAKWAVATAASTGMAAAQSGGGEGPGDDADKQESRKDK